MAFVVAALLMGVSGCAASAGGVECKFDVHNVHPSTGSPGFMDVKATGKCDGSFGKATVTVWFEKKVNGKWSKVTLSQATRTIQPVKAGTKYTAMSSKNTRCVSGVYRGATTGTMTVNGKTYNSYQTGYGPESTVKC